MHLFIVCSFDINVFKFLTVFESIDIVPINCIIGVIILFASIFSSGSGSSSSSSSSQRKALEKAMEKSVTGEEMSPREKSEYDSYKKWEQKQKWDSYDKQYK